MKCLDCPYHHHLYWRMYGVDSDRHVEYDSYVETLSFCKNQIIVYSHIAFTRQIKHRTPTSTDVKVFSDHGILLCTATVPIYQTRKPW